MPVICSHSAYSLNNGIASVSSDVTEMPPGFPLLPASVGHAVQTDQRSHDKERANTGAHSAARTDSEQHVGTKKRSRNKDRKMAN